MAKPRPTRREMLVGTSAIAALLGSGGIRFAFAQDAPRATEREDVLAAFRRARRAAKPLLVLLIPRDYGERMDAGRMWGEVLNHGADSTLALFALCELVCTTPGALSDLLPSFAVPPDTRAVLVETHRVPARAAALRTDIPPLPGLSYLADARSEDAIVDARIAGVEAALRALLLETDADLELRASAALRRLSRADRARVIEAVRGDLSIGLGLVDRAAALVLREAHAATPELRARAERQLAAAARHRLVDRPPPGAATRWSHDFGCRPTWERTEADRARERERRAARLRRHGAAVVALEDIIVAGCGMGHVPRRSQRFLQFYAAVPLPG